MPETMHTLHRLYTVHVHYVFLGLAFIFEKTWLRHLGKPDTSKVLLLFLYLGPYPDH